MHQKKTERLDLDPQETSEWLQALDQVVEEAGPDRASFLLERLAQRARNVGVELPIQHNTPYINTIPPEEEVPFPGDRALERRIKTLTRWNAMAMVSRQNKFDHGIGGHIATYASIATLFEVGFNHFFHASYGDQPGDCIYFQGHASPGVYARAFLEGRLTAERLANFRHELRDHPGLSSYPHPWLMPDFWKFPTVSMGLAPINAIYQARFMRYLENRGLIAQTPRKVWAFLGDGEMDEPESMGSLTLASREKLDNLIFVVNCNLQRLDGPVRGNGKIIQELEAAFLGAGWNVIKVLWGSRWDPLLARDHQGLLRRVMEECVDGEYQNFKAKGGAYTREHFFGKYPELKAMVANMSDEELDRLPFRKPDEAADEARYLHERRTALGGYLPSRRHTAPALLIPPLEAFASLLEGTGEREISTTMAFVRALTILLKDKNIGRNIVPIVPDEARTFGMEGLFRQIGIYSSVGQLYTPQDAETLMSYREDKKGQMIEEGINEAGSLCSWMAAGTAYSNHGINMVPFYIFYSMFGFQRVGDFIWAAGDMQVRGFLLGATAGRTTLAGEGLQHQDGHSQLVASTVPNCVAYDPAFAYELAGS